MTQFYKIHDLETAKSFLSHTNQDVIITNPPGSVKYYGTLTIDYIFKTLSSEFSHVKGCVFNVDHDIAGLLTAIELGYTQIRYRDKLLDFSKK